MKKPDAYIRAIADLKKAKDKGDKTDVDTISDRMDEIITACSRSELREILEKIAPFRMPA